MRPIAETYMKRLEWTDIWKYCQPENLFVR